MATDPTVQAALEVLSTSHYLSMDLKRAELVVAAVTPLIRRQAFTEAADAIEAERLQWDSGPGHFNQGRDVGFILAAAALVRGLGEGTDA